LEKGSCLSVNADFLASSKFKLSVPESGP
jgi:hypothetical protein